MAEIAELSGKLGSWLTLLTALPFVRAAKLIELEPPLGFRRFDAIVRIETTAGVFDYLTEVKRSYLDVAVTRAIAAVAREVARHNRKMLLFARYIPQPTARRLIDAGVEFADLAGNIHLDLDSHYHWTVLGNRERAVAGRESAQTPSTLKMLFAMMANPESAQWTVRELAAEAGVSKSKAASSRRDYLNDGTIREVEGHIQITDPQHLTDQLLSGYRQILRPHLAIGRFRSQERSVEAFLVRLRQEAEVERLRYALSGSIAAYQLQKFYKGSAATAFVQPSSADLLKRLRLLPDREGPITLLKAFGEVVFWRTMDHTSLAHPWLIYAELMSESDPRAHEAAEELRKEVLVL